MMRVQDLQLAPVKPLQNCFLENSQEKLAAFLDQPSQESI